MNGAAIVEIPEGATASVDRVPGDAHAKLTLLEYGDCICGSTCIQAESQMQHLVNTHRGRI